MCVNIGDDFQIEKRVVRHPNIICWRGHHGFFVYTLVIPVLVSTGLVVPLLITYKISSAKYEKGVEKKKFLHNFSKFILPFRDSRAFYGILLIINKIIVVILKELLILMTVSGDIIVMLLIILIYLIAYYFLNFLANPYRKDKYLKLQLL